VPIQIEPGVLLALPTFWAGANKVITMELLGKIRRMYVRDKMSERAIAKRTGLSRNTVHKWLEIPEEVQAPRYVRAEKFGKLTALAGELGRRWRKIKPKR
jgi:hypothetical protein